MASRGSETTFGLIFCTYMGVPAGIDIGEDARAHAGCEEAGVFRGDADSAGKKEVFGGDETLGRKFVVSEGSQQFRQQHVAAIGRFDGATVAGNEDHVLSPA